MRIHRLPVFLALSIVLILLALRLEAAKRVTAPKWQPIELSFKSAVAYTNPLKDAEMRVIFVSPLGETNRVYGFWDGDRTWRVRFSPDFAGQWTYFTMCSDTANRGLHGQSGNFLCSAPQGDGNFDVHGPLQVARAQDHFEHADHTPFLWLGDAAWDAGIRATVADWVEYLQTRRRQEFNVIQFKLTPVSTSDSQQLFANSFDSGVNLKLARELDAKIELANRLGLLCAIAPIWEMGDVDNGRLPAEEVIRRVRYALARWDSADVAWIMAFEPASTDADCMRWKEISQAAFQPVTHAPVVVLTGEAFWALDQFRSLPWVAGLGLQTTSASEENSWPWLMFGPLSKERFKTPIRPVLSLAPPAEVAGTIQEAGTVNESTARRLLWWSVLHNSPAGVSYAAIAVAHWEVFGNPATTESNWEQALSLPGAAGMAVLSQVLNEAEFWQLSPLKQNQGTAEEGLTAGPAIAGATTADSDWSVVFAPAGTKLSLPENLFSTRSRTQWFDTQTGEFLAAKGLVVGDTRQYEPPTATDAVLVITEKISRAARAQARKHQAEIDNLRRD